MNAVAAKSNIPIFGYAEEYDKEHYPVKDFMLERLILVHRKLLLPHRGKWIYFATIHGVIFEYDTSSLHRGSINRLDPADLKFFSELPNLRYIEVHDKKVGFALTHYEDEVPK